MMKIFSWVLCVALLSGASHAQERRYTLLERELEYLMEIWPGDYNNREQVQNDADLGRPTYETGGPLRVHAQISRVELPEFGQHVLYVEEYKDDDPSSIFRQRLYEISADEDEQAIRIVLYYFKDKQKWLGAHDDPSVLVGLTRNDTTTLDGCDIFLRRDGGHLTGGIRKGDCAFGEGSERGYSDYQVRVEDETYGFREHFVSVETGDDIEAVAKFRWHDLKRARWFMCMIDFPYETGKPAMYTEHYARVHDQGGIFSFTHPDGRPMTLSMRNRWSYGMQRDSFVIKVHDGSEPAPDLVYAWGSPGDDRIGLNPGWIRVQCDLDTPRNRKLQRDLRHDS